MKNHCIPVLATESKKLRKNLANREKAVAVSKTATKGSGTRLYSAVKWRVPTLTMELDSAKTLRLCLVKVATRSEANVKEVRTNLQDSLACLIEVEQKSKLTR